MCALHTCMCVCDWDVITAIAVWREQIGPEHADMYRVRAHCYTHCDAIICANIIRTHVLRVCANISGPNSIWNDGEFAIMMCVRTMTSDDRWWFGSRRQFWYSIVFFRPNTPIITNPNCIF